MPRFHFARVSFAKEKSSALRDALRQHLLSVRLGECREAYARICGYRTWHELVRVTDGGGATPSPLVADAGADDAPILSAAFGISMEAAHEVLAAVRPRALSAKPAGNGIVLPLGWEGIANDLRGLLGPAACPPSRLFLIGGEFGSGISMALSALVSHRVASNPRERIALISDRDFATTAVPEFGVGRTISGVGPGSVRSSVRSMPSVIVSPRPADPAMAADLFHAAASGHAVYVLSPGDGVGKAAARLFDPFPEHQRAGMASVVAEALGVVCTQRLVRGAETSRRVVPLREFAVFDDAARERLKAVHPSEWAGAVERMMADGSIRSQTYAQAAEAALSAGLIDETVRDGALGRSVEPVASRSDEERAAGFWTAGPSIAAAMRRDLGEAMSPRAGLFLMGGKAGSGKSLTLRSVVQDVDERDPSRVLRIVGPEDFPSGREGWPPLAHWHGGIDEPLEGGMVDATRFGPATILARTPRDGTEMRAIVRSALSGNACYTAVACADGGGGGFEAVALHVPGFRTTLGGQGTCGFPRGRLLTALAGSTGGRRNGADP